MKEYTASKLREGGHKVIDRGAHSHDPVDGYPPVCIARGGAVVADPGSLRIVTEGSGNGGQITAGKARGVRTALAWSLETVRLGRKHNGTNVVAIGAYQHDYEEALSFVELLIDAPFSGDERHQ